MSTKKIYKVFMLSLHVKQPSSRKALEPEEANMPNILNYINVTRDKIFFRLFYIKWA